jgi:hypothetical protein
MWAAAVLYLSNTTEGRGAACGSCNEELACQGSSSRFQYREANSSDTASVLWGEDFAMKGDPAAGTCSRWANLQWCDDTGDDGADGPGRVLQHREDGRAHPCRAVDPAMSVRWV